MTSPGPVIPDALRARWVRLGDPFDTRAGREVGEELIARYGAPERHYHDQRHLLGVLEALDHLASPDRPSTVVQLGAWFHDAVHDRRPGEDEEASATLAEERLGRLGLAPEPIRSVAALVRATAGHLDDPTTTGRDTGLLLDADLAILGADPVTYDTYCDDVRAEYAHVPDDAFRVGRLGVVEGLLRRRTLYLTAAGAARFEDQARTNLTRERDRLRSATTT